MRAGEAKKIRGILAKDLRDFGLLLARKNIIPPGTSSFHTAAASCKENSFPRTKNIIHNLSWGYSLDRTLIYLSEKQFKIRHPKNATAISMEFTVEIVGLLCDEDILEDPLQILNFNININAKSKADTNLKLRSCWHLDRSIEGGNTPQEAHPCYHFQFGGRNMNFDEADYGSTLFLDPPRLAHKPLDAILATDFILSNFRGDDWIDLRNDGQYKNIIERAQERLWHPYARAAADYWNRRALRSNTWRPNTIWPQLVLKEAV